MQTSFAKADLQFFVDAMDKRSHRFQPRDLRDDPSPIGAKDKVGGDMSVPKPVTVDYPGTMDEKEYKACSMIMAVCQNMIQSTLIGAAKAAGVPPEDALKNMNAWVKAYVDFPFPFFNFKDAQSDVYSKKDFSLTADPDVVDNIVNIKGVAGLKDAVVGALKKSGGNLVKYSNQERSFKYFGILTVYNERDISTRVIKFEMGMKDTNVDSLCVKYTNTSLNTSYDTYQFVADKELMIKMQAKMGDKLIEHMAEILLKFVIEFYDKELINFQQGLQDLLKPAEPVKPVEPVKPS